jgi:hypothetical protein
MGCGRNSKGNPSWNDRGLGSPERQGLFQPGHRLSMAFKRNWLVYPRGDPVSQLNASQADGT